jgi:hypothetical protein
MIDNRQKQQYKNWTLTEAGILEDDRRKMFVIVAQSEFQRQDNGELDAASTISAMRYGRLACVKPIVKLEEFLTLPRADVMELCRLSGELNPTWAREDNLDALDGIDFDTEKKSKSNQPDGMSDFPATLKAARPRHNSRKASK